MHNVMRTHAARRLDLALALDHCYHVASHGLSNMHEHEPDGPSSDYSHGVADLHSRLMQSAKHASQGLNHRSFLTTHMSRYGQHVDISGSARDADVFCISSVVDEAVFAKMLVVGRAVKTALAGARVQRNHPRALLEAAYARPNFFNDAGEFMPEQRRRDNHSRM